MAIRLILILGALALAFLSAGLFLVRLSHPRLVGLGRVCAAAAAAGMGSLLMVWSGGPDLLTGVLSDVMVLGAIVLFETAVLEVAESASLIPWLGLGLLAVQALVDLLVLYGGCPRQLRVVLFGLLASAQVMQTAKRLIGMARRGAGAPAWFMVALMAAFVVCNVVRSTAIAFGVLSRHHISYQVAVVTFCLYIAEALGMPFGFFWMTTTLWASRLEEMASTDPLTRVYNRRMFLQWCERELERSRERESGFSLLMIDLDHFKRINDEYGHRMGDEALCAVVESVQDAVRGIDVIGRWGGEEFAVLLPGAGANDALVVAQRVRRNVERISLAKPGGPMGRISLTVSVGVATYGGQADGVEAMLDRADGAMYEAKAMGRNRVMAF
jgi:diguanylate cyclase (GGDEF)-like protein